MLQEESREQDKKKSCSQSRQQIYLGKILRLCVITKLKVTLGDKNISASSEDNKQPVRTCTFTVWRADTVIYVLSFQREKKWGKREER